MRPLKGCFTSIFLIYLLLLEVQRFSFIKLNPCLWYKRMNEAIITPRLLNIFGNLSYCFYMSLIVLLNSQF